MPVIAIDGPKIADLDVKRRLVRELTESAVKAYGLPREAITVLLREGTPENVSVGGTLICDRKT
ncbi:MAG: 4-oxalocrotonate tautomerase DmpI [Methermicoccaceae archaeon]